MSAFYTRMRATAKRLIDRFDQEGTDKVAQSFTPNPDPLKPPTVASTASPVPAVVRGVSGTIVGEHTNLRMSDLQVICSPLDYTPEPEATVKINGRNHTVISVQPIPAAGMVCAYRFFVR